VVVVVGGRGKGGGEGVRGTSFLAVPLSSTFSFLSSVVKMTPVLC